MEIWTDGSCNPNPGAGGWGVHRSDGKEWCGGALNTTNNRMEMTAILEALIELPNKQPATIFSDSQYCIKGLTIWRHGWKKKNWRKGGADMPNRDLWLALEAQLNRLQGPLSFLWVRGHNGNAGNERADALAEEGRQIALSSAGQLASVKPPARVVTPPPEAPTIDTAAMYRALRDAHIVLIGINCYPHMKSFASIKAQEDIEAILNASPEIAA